MMAEFRTVTGRWLAKTPDGRDQDIHPDGVPLWGHVRFEPVYKKGALAYPGVGRFVEPQTIPARLIDGDLKIEVLVEDPDHPEDDAYTTQPVSLLVSEDPAATQSWSYRMIFDRVTIGEDGPEITLPDHRFSLPPGEEPLDLVATVGQITSGMITVKGPPGAGLEIQGAVDTTSDLPADAEPGHGWLVGEDLHVSTGSGWINVGPVRGPRGERGAPGPAGDIPGSWDGAITALHAAAT